MSTAQATPDRRVTPSLPGGRNRSTFAAYIELTKPRITVLLLITCIAGMFATGQGSPSLVTLLVTSLGLAMSSAGASALNHVLDRDIDLLMTRTATRPVACGQISPRDGTIFGVSLMVLAVILLILTTNALTAALAFFGGAFYVGGYTMVLKRRTPQNIVIGGAAGAIPPLVGSAAVTNSITLGALSLFLIVFVWTPPHFWALALLIREDYARAKVPMLPVASGERETVKQIWIYSVLLVIVTGVPVVTGEFGWFYVAAALILNIRFLQVADALVRACDHWNGEGNLVVPGKRAHRAARRLFLFSMAWLALIFLAVVIDQTLLNFPIA